MPAGQLELTKSTSASNHSMPLAQYSPVAIEALWAAIGRISRWSSCLRHKRPTVPDRTKYLREYWCFRLLALPDVFMSTFAEVGVNHPHTVEVIGSTTGRSFGVKLHVRRQLPAATKPEHICSVSLPTTLDGRSICASDLAAATPRQSYCVNGMAHK